MNHVLIDAIKAVSLFNGVVRVDCVAAGSNNEERPSATLLIPGNQAAQIVQSLAQSLQELDKKLREQVQQQQGAPGTGKAAN